MTKNLPQTMRGLALSALLATVSIAACSSHDSGAPPANVADAGAEGDGGSTSTLEAATPPIGVEAGADGGTGVEPARVCPPFGGRTIVVAKSGGDHASVQAGVDAAEAGDRVVVRAGVYGESVTFPRSGSAQAGCIHLEGESDAILDGSTGGEVGITIANASYISVSGLTIRNYKSGETPMGISVSGSAHHIELRKNVVHGIESADNAHGIAFYGTAATPMSDLLIDENEIRDCKLGQSESMVLNGNVMRFVVSRNHVHDNDNIGIDFIGFEGVGPSGQDQAREGICVDNVVDAITSSNNPTYGGEHSAGGIYVDGGRDIVIERNRISRADIGIEVASEHGGRVTSNITVRNNFVSGSYQGSVMIGGYDASRGAAEKIQVVGNTLYGGGDGEVLLQYNAQDVFIANNILVAKSGNDYVAETGGNNGAVTLDTNLYFGASASSAGAFTDPSGKFVDPKLVAPPADLHLADGSPAIGAGHVLPAATVGALDVDGTPRTQGGAPDLGADER